jgi:hypothetical protein
MTIDRRLTLTQLENEDWGPPPWQSSVVLGVHRLRHKPLGEFTVEDLRLMIGQRISLNYLMPLALKRLQDDPLAEGSLYAGDLLCAVLEAGSDYWRSHPEHQEQVLQLTDMAYQRLDRLAADTDVERQSLSSAMIDFRLHTAKI